MVFKVLKNKVVGDCQDVADSDDASTGDNKNYLAIASCDAIRATKLEKEKAYAKLERNCNEALLNLDNNPLVADMRTEIKILQGLVDGLHSECTRLLLQEMVALKHDRASVIAKVVPDTATKLIRSDEMDVADSDDASAGVNKNYLVGTPLPPLPEAGKKLRSLNKRKLPSGVGDSLLKAIALCDAIRATKLEKEKAYAELERNCNEALLNLDNNPLVADMRTEIKILHGLVDGLHSECTRLLLQEMVALKHDRALVIAKVVPDTATKLIRSDEMGMLVAKLIKASIIYCRCTAFEVAKLKEPFVMEKMAGYRPSSK
nr:hypothetical protein [Tanacetum cinerariifolium]